MKKWTKEEIEHLEKVFPLLRTDELEVTFGRKYDTIRKKAAQVGCKRALRNKSITKRGIDLKPRKKKHSYLLEDTKKVLSDISKYKADPFWFMFPSPIKNPSQYALSCVSIFSKMAWSNWYFLNLLI